MKPPKAKIVKAHKLADELLAIWQESIRPWYRDDGETNPDGPGTTVIDDTTLAILNIFREMRVRVEQE